LLSSYYFFFLEKFVYVFDKAFAPEAGDLKVFFLARS
jgi:hypothetical protein